MIQLTDQLNVFICGLRPLPQVHFAGCAQVIMSHDLANHDCFVREAQHKLFLVSNDGFFKCDNTCYVNYRC